MEPEYGEAGQCTIESKNGYITKKGIFKPYIQ